MHIQFAELPVTDQDRAKAFYTEHFGCETAADQPMPDQDWRWVEIRFPDAETTLHFLPRSDEKSPSGPVLVLVVDRLEDVISRLRSTGVEITSDPQPAPWRPGTTIAEFRDSEGNRIGVSSR
jgi:predicted enzyme related to lactoylglutathione lyase